MNTATKPDHNLNLVLFTSYFKLSQKHLSFLFCTVFPPVFAAEGGDKLQIHAQSAAPTDWQPSSHLQRRAFVWLCIKLFYVPREFTARLEAESKWNVLWREQRQV